MICLVEESRGVLRVKVYEDKPLFWQEAIQDFGRIAEEVNGGKFEDEGFIDNCLEVGEFEVDTYKLSLLTSSETV